MKLVATLGAALVVVLAASAPAAAVDEGVPDGDAHPAVGLLGVDFDAGGPAPPSLWCTGSVISDRAFLTAAHCISAQPADVGWAVTLRGGSPAEPVATPGLFPDDFPFWFAVPATPATAVVTHPRFDPERLAHDVAVALFPPGTFAGVEPVALPAAGLLDSLGRRQLRRERFRLVGYGVDPERGDAGTRFISEGYRQTAVAPFRTLRRTQLHLEGAARSGLGGLCYGDSGGPQLLGSAEVAVSLLSDPGDECRGPIRAQRLDTPAERAFLSRYAASP